MDALQSERDQNITIDTAQIWFHTAKTPVRHHRRAGPQGISQKHDHRRGQRRGGAAADRRPRRRAGAIAPARLSAQSAGHPPDRRAGQQDGLGRLLPGALQRRSRRSSAPFLKTVGVEPNCFIPMAAKHGDNIAALERQHAVVARARPCWKRWTNSRRREPPTNQPLRFPIQDIYRFDERRILAGRVESGTLKVGDRLVFSPANKVSTVKTIERWSAPARTQAEAGESIGITLTEQIFVERGAVAALETAPPYELSPVQGAPVLAGRAPMFAGKTTSSSWPRRKWSATSSPSRASSIPPRSETIRARSLSSAATKWRN